MIHGQINKVHEMIIKEVVDEGHEVKGEILGENVDGTLTFTYIEL